MEEANAPQVVVVTEGSTETANETLASVKEKLKNFSISQVELGVIQKAKEKLDTGLAGTVWKIIHGAIQEWEYLVQNNQEYLLNMVREVEKRLKEMRSFYGKRKTKKEIEGLRKSSKELKGNVNKLSDRIKSLAAFMEKINSTFDSQLKNIMSKT